MAKPNNYTDDQLGIILQGVADWSPLKDINALLAQTVPCIQISSSILTYYRKTLNPKIDEINRERQTKYLTMGLARKEARIEVLVKLADKMVQDIHDPALKRMWVKRIRGLGQGKAMQLIEEEEFNSPELIQLRGVLEDIAKEMGHRQTKVEVAIPETIKVTIMPKADSKDIPNSQEEGA